MAMITIRQATSDDAPATISFQQVMAMETEGMEYGIAGLRLCVESDNMHAQKACEAMGMNGNHYRTFEWML